MQTTFNVMTDGDFVASYSNERHANKHAKLVGGYVDVTNMSDVMDAVLMGYRYYSMTLNAGDFNNLLNIQSYSAEEQFKICRISDLPVRLRGYGKHEDFYNCGVWASNEDHAIRLVNQMLYDDGVIDVYGE